MQFTDENLSNFILNVRANMQLVIPMACPLQCIVFALQCMAHFGAAALVEHPKRFTVICS
jgi:hypothetical protein